MEVNINEIVSTIHAVDGESLLTPKTMERIVNAVVKAINERDDHRARVRAEQKISGGVREEQEMESR